MFKSLIQAPTGSYGKSVLAMASVMDDAKLFIRPTTEYQSTTEFELRIGPDRWEKIFLPHETLEKTWSDSILWLYRLLFGQRANEVLELYSKLAASNIPVARRAAEFRRPPPPPLVDAGPARMVTL